jgi:acetyl esterase/lipase
MVGTTEGGKGGGKMNRANRWCACVLVLVIASAAHTRAAVQTDIRWNSPATGSTLAARVQTPPDPARKSDTPLATVVFLKNLSLPRLGRDTDEQIVGDLLKRGHLVIEIDYAKHAKAIGPDLQADVLALRQEIGQHKFLSDYPVDFKHLFIIPEGFQLRRDIEFARDGQRVLAMDIMYPSRSEKPVAALMEITCDNANRMGNGSLVFCHDTLLEGAMFAGFAAAMIDHPVRPPYKGLDDPMPELVHRLKAAVRTLRAAGKEIGMSEDIGAIGFSRGSNMAALLATTADQPELEGDGLHPGVSSRVQAAMAHGGRFDFLHLRSDDPMLDRYAKAWGPRESNSDRWASHGALHYLRGAKVAPMYLNTSNTESPEFRQQLSLLAERLKEANVPYVYTEDADGRGHRVTTDPKTLADVYRFFAKHLDARAQEPRE